jgi:hypothetical protein
MGLAMGLCIFTQMGETYTFRSVHITVDNETMLIFTYTAVSDGLVKTGCFLKANMAGWSTW